MTSPAPLLRPPVPGAHRNKRPPLSLGIPPSPNVKPVNQAGTVIGPDGQQQPSRPAPPQLRLATPMGSKSVPHDNTALYNGRPIPQHYNGNSANGFDDSAAHSRTGSFAGYDGRNSGPASATSSTYSSLSVAMGLRQHHGSTPDPSSAISSGYSDRGDQMERENGVNGLPDLDKLSLEAGRPLDVEDLDDEKWLAASEQGKIIELDSLGEGAGGAVTRCVLKGGKTVFALKV